MARRFTALFLSVLFLVSCSSAPASSGGQATPPQDDHTENASPYAYFELGDIWPGKDGIYRLRVNEDSSQNILYADYETAQEVVLCNQPNCEHNSDICTGWIPDTGGSVAFYALENALLLQFGGTVDTEKAMVQVLPHFEKMDLNGANRQVFPDMPQVLLFDYAIVANEDNVIFMAHEGENANNVLGGAQVLTKMSLADGSVQKLADLAPEQEDDGKNVFQPTTSYSLVGARGDGVIMKARVARQPLSEDVDFDTMVASLEDTFYLYPDDGSAPQKLYRHMQKGYEDRVLPGGDIFSVVQTADGNVSFVLHRADGTEQVLADRVPELDDTLLMNIKPLALDAGHVQLLVYVGDSDLMYVYDLANASLTPVTLEFLYGNVYQPVWVLATCRDSFFVQSGVHPVSTETHYSETAGGMATHTTYGPDYSFITQADYYASTPNYREIQTAD